MQTTINLAATVTKLATPAAATTENLLEAHNDESEADDHGAPFENGHVSNSSIGTANGGLCSLQ